MGASIDDSLASLRRGVWELEGTEIPIKDLPEARLRKIAADIDALRRGNGLQFFARCAEAVRILQIEADRRGFKLFANLCKCGKSGLREVGSEVFCKTCLPKAFQLGRRNVEYGEKSRSLGGLDPAVVRGGEEISRLHHRGLRGGRKKNL